MSPVARGRSSVVAATFAVDTSCMVAVACAWHEFHDAAAKEVERRLERGERLVVPAHALLETYAVLTRLPSPHRLSPADAWTLIEANFVKGASLPVLSAAGHRRLLQRLARDGTAGGRTYDGLIGECAQFGRATTLLTFNRRHFTPPPRGLTIVEPAAAR
jgi:predicted nucleic acid-binding protein